MKKLLPTIMVGLTCWFASAQIQVINTATGLQTNIQVSSAFLTVSGLFTNLPYTASNPAAITVGDSFNTAMGKINSSFTYCSNAFGVLNNQNNQFFANWQTNSVSLAGLVLGVEASNALTMTSLNTLSNRLVIVSNNFVSVSNTLYRFFATNAPGEKFPDLTDTAGCVGIAQPAPAYPLDVNGAVQIVGGASADDVSLVINNDGVGTIMEAVYSGGAPGTCQAALAPGSGFFRSEGGGYIYFDSTMSKIGNDATAQVFLCNGSGGLDMIDESGYGAHLDGSGNFVVDDAFSSDNYAFCSDGGGNVTCQSLTQTSDLTLKTNLAPYAPANLLPALASVPVYSWRFRDRVIYHTNARPVVVWGTNTAAFTNRAGGLIGRPVRFVQSSNLVFSITTNLHAGQKHIGPLAQDFSAQFGGPTNAISVTDMQGVLLAGLQALASPSRTPAVAGTIYPSNTWNLSAITHGMPNFSFWTGNSNGQALVTLSLSNGVVRYLQSLR